MGRGGYTVQKMKDSLVVNNDGQFEASIIDDVLTHCQTTTNYLEKCQQALGTQQPTYIVINIGVNDPGPYVPPWTLPNQTTWQNNYISIIDSVHAQWPLATIGLTKPWKLQTGGDNTTWDIMAGWIDNIHTARPTFTIILDDERSWFQGHPEYSPDTPPNIIHYNTPLGSVVGASVKFTALGF
jgi:hypothetical protein